MPFRMTTAILKLLRLQNDSFPLIHVLINIVARKNSSKSSELSLRGKFGAAKCGPPRTKIK